ncbi:ribonuclease H-like domain-containing protein [Tanacetum coccineum]
MLYLAVQTNVNTARHNFNSQAVPTNAARKVHTVKSIVNNVRPKTVLHKTYSPIRRPINRTTAPRAKFSNKKVNTAEVKVVSAIGEKGETTVKPSAGCNWRPKRHYRNKVSKYNGRSNSRIYVTFKDPLGRPKPKKAWAHDGKQGLLLNTQDFTGACCFWEVVKMCDKKNKVLFTDTKCLVLSPDFKLPDENQVLLRGIKREYSNARTPQQNGVAERKNRTLIKAARTMLPVRSENQANKHAGPKEANHSVGTQDNIDAGNSEMEAESAQDYFVLPIWSSYTSTVKNSKAKNEGEKSTKNTDLKTNEKPVDQEDQAFLDELERLKRQEKEANDAAEALRKEFAQDTEDLLLQAGAARASLY